MCTDRPTAVIDNGFEIRKTTRFYTWSDCEKIALVNALRKVQSSWSQIGREVEKSRRLRLDR